MQLLLAVEAGNPKWPWFDPDRAEIERKLTRAVNGCPRCRVEMVDVGSTQVAYKCFLCFPTSGGGMDDGSDPRAIDDGDTVMLRARPDSPYRGLLIELRKLTRQEAFRRSVL